MEEMLESDLGVASGSIDGGLISACMSRLPPAMIAPLQKAVAADALIPMNAGRTGAAKIAAAIRPAVSRSCRTPSFFGIGQMNNVCSGSGRVQSHRYDGSGLSSS